MKKLQAFMLITVSSIILFAFADFALTLAGLDPFTRLQKAKIEPHHTRHPVYHHDLLPNLNALVAWGVNAHQLCTNQFGFKISCSSKDSLAKKNYDLAFIGDSFTEAVGMSYENSFVGMYAAKHPQYSVANMGIISYSPSIYLRKIRYLLDLGVTFKHLVVLPDISDIQDEAIYYIIDPEKNIIVDKWNMSREKQLETITMIREEAEGKVAQATAAAQGEQKNPPLNSIEAKSSDNDSVPPPMAVPTKRKDNIVANYFKYTWYINMRLHAFFHPALSPLEDFDRLHNRAFWTTDLNTPEYGPGGVAEGINQALYNMRVLKRLLDKHGIKMSVAVYPWPSQLMNNKPDHLGVAIWRDFCVKENCANFIDTNGFFFKEVEKAGLLETINKYYIDGDVHFNRNGNMVIAEELNKNLVLY